MHAAQSGRPQQRCLSQRRLPQPGSQLEHPRQLEHPAWAPPAPSLSLPARPAAHGVPAGAGRLPSGWHVARIVDQGVRLRLDCGTAWRRGRQVVIISQPAGQSQWPAAPLGKPCFADCSMPTPGSAAACTTPLAAEAASRTPLRAASAAPTAPDAASATSPTAPWQVWVAELLYVEVPLPARQKGSTYRVPLPPTDLPTPTSVASLVSSIAPSAASFASAPAATGSSPYPPMSGSSLCGKGVAGAAGEVWLVQAPCCRLGGRPTAAVARVLARLDLHAALILARLPGACTSVQAVAASTAVGLRQGSMATGTATTLQQPRLAAAPRARPGCAQPTPAAAV